MFAIILFNKKILPLLRGSFYIPIEFLHNLIYHFEIDLKPLLAPEIQICFENFINYLKKWYFSESSIFKKNDWNYHLKIVDILNNSQ